MYKRQHSDIVVNAHKIHNGEQVSLDNKSRDFFFLKRYDADIIIRVVIALIPVSYTHLDVYKRQREGIHVSNAVMADFLL